MINTRIIVVLLVNQELHLIKTIAFDRRTYLGDPLNAAFIFSGFEVDELLVLHIDATRNSDTIPISFVESLSRFTNVPLSVGGGIKDLDQIQHILSLGVEKIVLSSALNANFGLLEAAVSRFGSSTISVIINTFITSNGSMFSCFGRPDMTNNYHPTIDLASRCEQSGAGELIFNSVDRDGSLCGFQSDLLADLNSVLHIPLVGLGGCGSIDHISFAIGKAPLSGIAAGSLFVYAPGTSQVLLNYPPRILNRNNQLSFK